MVPTLIYDAHCRLCESTKDWVGRWGRYRQIRFLHYEDPQAYALQPDLAGVEYLDAFRFIDNEGRAWVGAQGVLQLLRVLPLGRPIAWILCFPGAYRLVKRVYGWVARNRYRMFGRVGN